MRVMFSQLTRLKAYLALHLRRGKYTLVWVVFPNSCVSVAFGLTPPSYHISLHAGWVFHASQLTCLGRIWLYSSAIVVFFHTGWVFSTHAFWTHLTLCLRRNGFTFMQFGFSRLTRLEGIWFCSSIIVDSSSCRFGFSTHASRAHLALRLHRNGFLFI